MASFNETNADSYNWETEKVYVIEYTDPVEGGMDGISNRQSKALTTRTRNLHNRTVVLNQQASKLSSDLAGLNKAVDIKTEAALRSAKEYADGADEIIQRDYKSADNVILQSAKDFANELISRLVDGSPEALNTLNELASALGDDPNFATTIATEIGKKANADTVNQSLSKKVDLPDAGNNYSLPIGDCSLKNNNNNGKLNFRHKNASNAFVEDEVYHSGSLQRLSQLTNDISTICSSARLANIDMSLAEIAGKLVFSQFVNGTVGSKPFTDGFLMTMAWNILGLGAQIAIEDGGAEAANRMAFRSIKNSTTGEWNEWKNVCTYSNPVIISEADGVITRSGYWAVYGDFLIMNFKQVQKNVCTAWAPITIPTEILNRVLVAGTYIAYGEKSDGILVPMKLTASKSESKLIFNIGLIGDSCPDIVYIQNISFRMS